MGLPTITIEYPVWVEEAVNWARCYSSDQEKIRFAIELSRLNVTEATGGPFGAAIFEVASGRLISVGVNLVVAKCNSILHGEIMAFMMAQHQMGSYTLNISGGPKYVLATSCEPCAMCLGATLWSGVSRVLCGATREDAQRLNFEEGPVFDASYAYLEERGVEFVREVCREEAVEVLELYRSGNGDVYNG